MTRVRRVGRAAGSLVVVPLVWLVRLYQRFVSPMRPPTCRYYPSCSAYAVTALERFGPGRGAWLAGRRLLRCHPWTPGGVDHVPDRDPVTGRPVPGTTGPKPYRAPGTEEPPPAVDAVEGVGSAERDRPPGDDRVGAPRGRVAPPSPAAVSGGAADARPASQP